MSDPGLTASASNNDERVTRIMSMTPTVQWQVVILPSETLLQFTSNNLRFHRVFCSLRFVLTDFDNLFDVETRSSTVIGILVGAVVQLLAVALYFVRNEAKRQRYKLALAEFRAADASMSKTLNAVCHELRNPLHGLQVSFDFLESGLWNLNALLSFGVCVYCREPWPYFFKIMRHSCCLT